MMKKEDNFYSGIKKNETSDGETLGKWYDGILSFPFIIIAVIIIAIIGNYSKISEFLSRNDNNGDGFLFLLLCIISVFAGIRAYQSFYLAKIDYSALKKYKRDCSTFVAVYIFLTAALLTSLHDDILHLYAIYMLITLIATVNFWDLFLLRLKKEEDKLDYICEKKIQFLNAIVFSILTVSLLLMIIVKKNNMDGTYIYVSFVIIICVLLLLNMLHSHSLTYIPKIILCNDKENNNDPHFKKMKICRMNEKDTDQIVDTIIKEFRYIFEYIFDTNDEKTLKRILRRLVTSCFGFGFLGYMNFYSIKQSKDDAKVGLIKIDTLLKCPIYQVLELFLLPIVIVISQPNIKKLQQIYKRSKEIVTSQPKLKGKTEFEITYFVIYEEFRNGKYGTCAMNLLVNALLHSKTNNINCSKLTLLVRESNAASLALVKKIGFEPYNPEENIIEPIEITEKQGRGIFFQYSKKNH